MGKISREDRVVIKALRVEMYWSSRHFLKEFSSKCWSRSSLDRLITKTDTRLMKTDWQNYWSRSSKPEKVCRCTVLLEHKVVTRHSAYRWQQYDVIMTSWSSIEQLSKRYHQNFLLCNNNEITACIADLFNSFCKEMYAVAFFEGSAATNYR